MDEIQTFNSPILFHQKIDVVTQDPEFPITCHLASDEKRSIEIEKVDANIGTNYVFENFTSAKQHLASETL